MDNQTEVMPPTGPAAAAFVGAGFGCFTLGVFTTLAEISEGVKGFLNWWNPAGPLTGKTGLAIIIWIVFWVILHLQWRQQHRRIGSALVLAILLLGLGLVGTFPTLFEMFSH